MIGVDSISYFKNGIVFPHVIYLVIKKDMVKKKKNEPNFQILAHGQENFIRDESCLPHYSFGKIIHA